METEKEIVKRLPEMSLKEGIILAYDIHNEYLLMKRCPANSGNKKWHRAWANFYERILKENSQLLH